MVEIVKDVIVWVVKMCNGLVLIGKVILLVNGYLESFGVEKGCFM